MESKISSSLRKWLGIPPSFISIGIYGRETKLTSTDECVRKAGVRLPTGRKWAVQNAVNKTMSPLKHQDIVGKVYIGRQGIGFGETASSNRWDNKNNKERRKMIT